MTHDGLNVPSDILDLSPEEMRELGYWVVDRTIEHLTSLTEQPVITVSDLDTLTGALGGPLPRDPASAAEGLQLLADVALKNQQHGDHPRYFARVPGPSSHAAILGDWMAIGMQSVATSWLGGSGTATIEVVALEWLREALGLRPGAQGVLTSGGSMANITCLIAARHRKGDGIVYLSDQTHSSIKRGLLAMGYADAAVRVLPTDPVTLRLNPSTVEQAVADDIAQGLRPTIVVATSGTTNTGAVDDLPALAKICASHGIWLHVDGAYGGPAALVPGSLDHLELADSFVVDPHKWLFQPYDIACAFVAEPGLLEETYSMNAEYLKDVTGGAVDLMHRSLELTRRSRAAKLWLTLRTYGMDAISDAVLRGIALAEYAQLRVEADDRLAVATPAQLGIVTFTAPNSSPEQHWAAAARLTADGLAAATCTVLHGKVVLRLCTINPRTTTDDIDVTVARLAEYVTSEI